MPLVQLIIVLVLIGVLMWAINTYVPMQAGIKRLMNIAVVVILVFWLLSAFGLLTGLPDIKVGK